MRARVAERARSGPLSRPVLSLVALLAFAVLTSLGVWQVQRLQWKQALLADMEAARTAPARPLATVLAREGGARAYARVRAVCPGLSHAPYLELYSPYEGVPGVRLISACRVDGGPFTGILVDRGFVAESISSRPPVDPTATAPREVIGVLRAAEEGNAFTPPNEAGRGRWYRRDIAAMAGALGLAKPAPWFLMLETSSNPEWRALQPAPLPVGLSNNHLGYAITWFGLAAALAGVYFAMVRRPRGAA